MQFGRYYEEIPMDLVIRSFSYERQPRIINYSPTSTVPDANAELDSKTSSAILGGFTEPANSRAHFGALLLGVREGDELKYAGKVGTGFTSESLREIKARLSRLEQKTAPFANPDALYRAYADKGLERLEKLLNG